MRGPRSKEFVIRGLDGENTPPSDKNCNSVKKLTHDFDRCLGVSALQCGYLSIHLCGYLVYRFPNSVDCHFGECHSESGTARLRGRRVSP